MTMRLSRYLEHIQKNENLTFAIDSISGQDKKKKKIIRPEYPNSNIKEQEDFKPKLIKRVMIDLDRTIHQYSKGFQDGSMYDAPFPQAREALQKLRSKGFEIVIFTSRVSPEVAAFHGQDLEEQYTNIENWLTNNEIPFDRVTATKLDADFYIDDKAIWVKNGDWESVLEQIDKRIDEEYQK